MNEDGEINKNVRPLFEDDGSCEHEFIVDVFVRQGEKYIVQQPFSKLQTCTKCKSRIFLGDLA